MHKLYSAGGSVVKKKLILLCVIAIPATSMASANTNELSIGAGAAIAQSPYKGYDNNVQPVPQIMYEGNNFWVHGLGAGYYLWNTDEDKLSATIYWAPFKFKSDDSSNQQLKQLDNRKSTAMAGLTYTHTTDYGFLRAALAGDMLGNSDGLTGNVGWMYPWSVSGIDFLSGAGLEFADSRQNNYYYGISQKESRKSGLSAYDAGNSRSPFLELNAAYSINKDWKVNVALRYLHLSDAVTDSPMVDKSWTGLLSTGVTYNF